MARKRRAVQALDFRYVAEAPTRWPPAAAPYRASSIPTGRRSPNHLHLNQRRIRLSTALHENFRGAIRRLVSVATASSPATSVRARMSPTSRDSGATCCKARSAFSAWLAALRLQHAPRAEGGGDARGDRRVLPVEIADHAGDEAVAGAVRPVEADRIEGGEGADQRVDAVRVLEREGGMAWSALRPRRARHGVGAVACTANHLSSTSGLSR